MKKDLQGINFDEQDTNLFLVKNLQLRADALKHSVVPRLQYLLNITIEKISEIYGVNVLDYSIVSIFPNFRQKRENSLQHEYQYAFAGIGGQRKDKWPGFTRKDGKPVKILPFGLHFHGFTVHISCTRKWLDAKFIL